MIYLRDGLFSLKYGKVNLHLTGGTHWVCYTNEKLFNSYGCAPPGKLSKFNIKRNGHCLYSEYKIIGFTSKKGSFCASYCSYKLYLTRVLCIDFKSAVLNLYYQVIKLLM